MQRRGRTGGGGAGMSLPLTQADLRPGAGPPNGSGGGGGGDGSPTSNGTRRRKAGKSTTTSCGRRFCQFLVLLVLMESAYWIGGIVYTGHANKLLPWKTILKENPHPRLVQKTAQRVLSHPIVQKTADRVLSHPIVQKTAKRIVKHAKGLYSKKSDTTKKNGRVLLNDASDETKKKEAPLYSQFNTLQYPFQHAKLVGLYFAASWCPMSTTPSNQLDEYFGTTLLPPPTTTTAQQQQEKQQQQLRRFKETTSSTAIATARHEQASLSIVYVSSDDTQEQLLNYQKQNWIAVPFDSDERTALKKQFSVCAKKELEPLHMERKYEIPTLILLDGETRTIVTTNGVDDLKEFGAKALDHWLGLVDLVRSLDEKYIK
jgi:hypothetical protein